MIYIKALSIEREKTLQLVSLTAIATIAPFFHQQAITGSIVNATLFVAVLLFGVRGAILVGFVPSLIALAVGTLPVLLAPMIPFIIIGNAILVIIFNGLKDRNYWLGVILAGFLKFLFLFSTSTLLMGLFFKKEIAANIAVMMGWPQFFTAVAGGLMTYFLLKQNEKRTEK